MGEKSDKRHPTREDIERIRSIDPFKYSGKIQRPGVRAVVSEQRSTFRMGTAIAGKFDVAADSTLDKCLQSKGLLYSEWGYNLGYEFLTSDAVERFLTEATPDDHSGETTVSGEELDPGEPLTDQSPSYMFEEIFPARLDGHVADMLLGGGAYNDFEGSFREAKALGDAFSEAIRDGRYDPSHPPILFGHFRWCDWFIGTSVWDWTVIWTDEEANQIRLFMATCTD